MTFIFRALARGDISLTTWSVDRAEVRTILQGRCVDGRRNAVQRVPVCHISYNGGTVLRRHCIVRHCNHEHGNRMILCTYNLVAHDL